MAMAEEGSDTYLLALIHDAIGSLYKNQFEFIKADREFEQAIAILRHQPGHPDSMAIALANLGDALSGEGRYREALASLSEASKLIRDNAVNNPTGGAQIDWFFGTLDEIADESLTATVG